MGIADMDFRSPEPVIQALRQRVEHGVFGYPGTIIPTHKGGLELCELLAERMQRLYAWQVQPEHIIFCPGVVFGLNLTSRALCSPGESLLVQPPVYQPILEAPAHTGLQRLEAPLVQDATGVYQVDWEAFEAALRRKPRLFILCNPHNPVGRLFSKDELQQMAALCLQHGTLICADEIHCDLIFNGRQHSPLAALDPEIARHTVTFMAPSKTFNLAGLFTSFAIIPDPALRKRFLLALSQTSGAINLMGWTAALAAYRDGQSWLQELLVYLQANRDYLAAFVRQELPNLKMAPPEATYLAWIDCRAAGLGEKPADFFLQQARLGLQDGTVYGTGGAGFVRLNFGCRRALLEQALQRMQQALSAHRGMA
jgi:cystathionine beta-lyase